MTKLPSTIPIPNRQPTQRRRSNPSAVWMKLSGILCMAMLVWINLSNGSRAERLLSTQEESNNAAMNTPRRLERKAHPRLEVGHQTMLEFALQDDDEITEKNFVTFVDTRPTTYVKKTDEELALEEENKKRGIKETKPKPPSPLHESRIHYLHACKSRGMKGRRILENFVKKMYQLLPLRERTNYPPSMEQCKYTFLDFGANVGDSLGKFIDSGLDNCEKEEDGYEYGPKYNIETGSMDEFHDKDNVLVRFARHVTRKAGRKGKPTIHYPEEYCYYGVEGNPVFTPRLKTLEDRVMNTVPRPVQSAHFLTETVGAGVDGPTVLYLDTISKDKNFWGSSVLTQPKYVRESAQRDNNGKPIGADVQGITLSTLIQQTTLREQGGHLVIKVDIEGGEFALFQEVHKSGVLCFYAASGVDVNILVEKHAPQFAAANLDMSLWDKFMTDLTKCGVVIQGGGSAGR